MKRIATCIFCLGLSLTALKSNAQTIAIRDSTDKVYTVVEKEPEFKGGKNLFYKYFQHTLRYPASAVKNHIQGNVLLTFIVEKDGALTNINVVKGVSDNIDAEAIRILEASPRWEPGEQGGKPVRVQYIIPLNFKLSSKDYSALQKQERLDELRRIDSSLNLPFEKKIFTWVENMPSFPGGLLDFHKYFEDNLKYPDEAKKDNIHGIVLLYFIIERDGSLSGIKIQKSLSQETDAEALRVMNNCPKWIPGTQNGKPARVAYNLEIPFPLANP